MWVGYEILNPLTNTNISPQVSKAQSNQKPKQEKSKKSKKRGKKTKDGKRRKKRRGSAQRRFQAEVAEKAKKFWDRHGQKAGVASEAIRQAVHRTLSGRSVTHYTNESGYRASQTSSGSRGRTPRAAPGTRVSIRTNRTGSTIFEVPLTGTTSATDSRARSTRTGSDQHDGSKITRTGSNLQFTSKLARTVSATGVGSKITRIVSKTKIGGESARTGSTSQKDK